MTTYAVQWRDPVSGHTASRFFDDYASAIVEQARLRRRDIEAVVVAWGEIEPAPRQTHGNGPLGAERGAGGPEAMPTTESA